MSHKFTTIRSIYNSVTTCNSCQLFAWLYNLSFMLCQSTKTGKELTEYLILKHSERRLFDFLLQTLSRIAIIVQDICWTAKNYINSQCVFCWITMLLIGVLRICLNNKSIFYLPKLNWTYSCGLFTFVRGGG